MKKKKQQIVCRSEYKEQCAIFVWAHQIIFTGQHPELVLLNGSPNGVKLSIGQAVKAKNNADVVMFLYIDEVYNKKTKDAGVAEINIAKQRNGPYGVVRLAWLKDYATFENLSRGE